MGGERLRNSQGLPYGSGALELQANWQQVKIIWWYVKKKTNGRVECDGDIFWDVSKSTRDEVKLENRIVEFSIADWEIIQKKYSEVLRNAWEDWDFIGELNRFHWTKNFSI